MPQDTLVGLIQLGSIEDQSAIKVLTHSETDSKPNKRGGQLVSREDPPNKDSHNAEGERMGQASHIRNLSHTLCHTLTHKHIPIGRLTSHILRRTSLIQRLTCLIRPAILQLTEASPTTRKTTELLIIYPNTLPTRGGTTMKRIWKRNPLSHSHRDNHDQQNGPSSSLLISRSISGTTFESDRMS